MSYNFFVHTDLVFGRDSLGKLPEVLSGDGLSRVMLIYDGGVKAAGIADKVIAQIQAAGVDAVIFDRVLPDPSNDLVEEAYAVARDSGIEGFVAVGGGSSIDLAKAVNVLMTNPGPIGQYGGIGLVKEKVLPLVAIPTTAGTSTEITNVTALTDKQAVCKYVVIDNKIVPSHVIADPELIRTMPRSVASATGMDAITHAVESYISNMATPLTAYHSLEGLCILYANLFKSINDPDDMVAKENMMLGCVITGMAFSNANLGLVHAVAHVLSAHFHLPHGLANALMLPHVMAFNAPACPEKMKELAQVIGLQLSGDETTDMYALSKELLSMTTALGMNHLSEHGVQESDFDRIAEDVLKEPVLQFNPRQNITKEEIKGLLRDAF